MVQTLEGTPQNPFAIETTSGLGALTALPPGTANGAPLPAPPVDMVGVRFYLPPNASVTFGIAATQPLGSPTTFTITAGSSPMYWDENLNGEMIYIVSFTGSPLFRWL